MQADPDAIYVIAGEPSGDLIGDRLIQALRAQAPNRAVHGIGGDAMAAAGLTSLFPMADLAVMGLVEVAPHIPRLLRRIDETVADILARRPAVVVTIDAPGFCFRVVKKLKQSGRYSGRLMHYVAPTVWAWKPQRARKIAGLYDHLLALLPFEPPYFEREGLKTTFVGHPVVERSLDQGDGAALRTRHGIAPETPVLAVLLGSRQGEVRRLSRVFDQTARRVAELAPDLTLVLPTVSTVAARVGSITANWPVPSLVLPDPADKVDAFAASNAALAASGTVAVELAAAGVPTVVGYRLDLLTGMIVKRMVTVNYVNLINLVLDRPAVPELLLGNCAPHKLAPALVRLLSDPDAAEAQRQAAREAMDRMCDADEAPSVRAARAVLDLARR